MSFLESVRRPIAADDHVVIYQSAESMSAVRVEPGAVFQCRYGRFPHSELIGKPFGSRVDAADGGGFVYVLHPTPELWTLVLPHRTQILYFADIAFITAQLDLVPGSVVVEAGTGSGSFSHSLARTVAPTGKLYTFEYHEQRAKQARVRPGYSEEFAAHGLDGVVIPQHRDVCANGFGLENVADAVFLDLPSPWDAIPGAKASLKSTVATRICTFSPSVEQVQRSCDALRRHGFSDIRTYETLLRPLEPWPAAPLLTALPVEGTAGPKKGKPAPFSTVAGAVWTHPAREMRGHTSYLTFATLLPPDAA